MSLCLGKGSRWGPDNMAPKPQDACALQKERFMSPPARTEARDRQLNLSLTAGEFEAIRHRAEAVGMRPAHFGRLVLLDAKNNLVIRPTSEESPLTRLIYNQLIRMGSNLNQMMRHLHRTGDPLPADIEPLLKDIRAMAEKVQAGKGRS